MKYVTFLGYESWENASTWERGYWWKSWCHRVLQQASYKIHFSFRACCKGVLDLTHNNLLVIARSLKRHMWETFHGCPNRPWLQLRCNSLLIAVLCQTSAAGVHVLYEGVMCGPPAGQVWSVSGRERGDWELSFIEDCDEIYKMALLLFSFLHHVPTDQGSGVRLVT